MVEIIKYKIASYQLLTIDEVGFSIRENPKGLQAVNVIKLPCINKG